MWKERVVLEHQTHAALFRRKEHVRPGNLLLIEIKLALRLSLDTGGNPKERGLSRSRWAEEAENAAGLGDEVDSVQNLL